MYTARSVTVDGFEQTRDESPEPFPAHAPVADRTSERACAHRQRQLRAYERWP
jgi:hypothetical protein